eukprot:7380455-Prymnesium_polylepis.1
MVASVEAMFDLFFGVCASLRACVYQACFDLSGEASTSAASSSRHAWKSGCSSAIEAKMSS